MYIYIHGPNYLEEGCGTVKPYMDYKLIESHEVNRNHNAFFSNII
jgi:hypothetical protein